MSFKKSISKILLENSLIYNFISSNISKKFHLIHWFEIELKHYH